MCNHREILSAGDGIFGKSDFRLFPSNPRRPTSMGLSSALLLIDLELRPESDQLSRPSPLTARPWVAMQSYTTNPRMDPRIIMEC